MNKVKSNLDGVSETLLISLWSRAQVIERDTKAKELVEHIDYDFSRFEKWKKHLKYTVIRTNIFDNEVTSFLTSHHDAIVVNIGAGLDTRFFRMDNGQIIWYELDLPSVISLRMQFFEETDRYRFISASITDDVWVHSIRENDRPILFIAEGVLMYLEQEDIKHFFTQIADHFSSAELVCEIVGPLGLKFKHPLIKKTHSNPLLKWGVWNVLDIEKWDTRIKIRTVHELSDSPISFLISKLLGNKILRLQFIKKK